MMTFLSRILALFRRRRLDREMAEEMASHLDRETEYHLAHGLPADEARWAARRAFGGVDQWQERERDERGFRWLDELARNFRHAARLLRKSPGFTATVVLTVALSIGACTVVFSAVNALILHPLVGRDPDRLVTIRSTRLPHQTSLAVSIADFDDLQRQAGSFAAMAAYGPSSRSLTGDGEPVRLRTLVVTANYFDLLGLPPELGRTFRPEDTVTGKDQVMMLSYEIWQELFGGRRDVIGQVVHLDGTPYTIIGVMPRDFSRAGGTVNWNDIALPMALPDAARTNRGDRYWLYVQARLKPGVSLAQAQAELDVLTDRLAHQYPDTNKGFGARVLPTGEFDSLAVRPILWSLLGAVGGVLLVACANVANLLLARGAVRQREISLRAAFGASRSQLLRLLLTESLLLSSLGGAAGALLAVGGMHFLRHVPGTSGLARLQYVSLDARVLVFVVALSVLTGLVFGLAPAWLGSRSNLGDTIKEGGRGTTEGRSRSRWRGALVIGEVACSLMLLVTAGLLLRSFITLAHVDTGTNLPRLDLLTVYLRGDRYVGPQGLKRDLAVQFADNLQERLRALPGVEATGYSSTTPLVSGKEWITTTPFTIVGRPLVDVADRPVTQWANASPDYFRTMGIKLVQGRIFTAHDNAGSPHVGLVNETFVRRFFAGENPVGRRLNLGDGGPDREWEIIGVVSDVAIALDEQAMPEVYVPFAQLPGTIVSTFIYTAGDPAAIVPALKAQVYAVDPDLAVAWAVPFQERVDDTVAEPRLVMRLLAVFAGFALVIAAIGIYGVISYSVSQRSAEFGIRLALGAQVNDVLFMVLGQGARLVGLGLAVGLVGMMIVGRAIESLLFHTSARDPLTMAGVTLFFAIIAGLACWLPARRATKVDPMIALRAQ